MSPAFTYGFFIFFVLFALGAAFLRIVSKRSLRDAYDKKAFRMGGDMAAWLTLFGFVWLFCTYEEVQIFGVRAWFVLWALVATLCAARLIYYLRKEAPALREKNAARSVGNIYLPRRSR